METIHDEGFNIPDPTDWKGTPLAGLEHVEQAFRCHICKDFYNSPMITSCNHTFCSLCIRRCLSQDGKCPLCRANDQEAKLRGNWALREAVEAFVKSRDGLLRFAKTPAPGLNSGSPKRKASELVGTEEDFQKTKRPRMSTRSTRGKGAEATVAMMQYEADTYESSEPAYEPEPDDGLVECPICLTRMKPLQVDRHLDTSCPGSQPQPPSQTTQTHSGFSAAFHSSPKQPKAPERLAPIAYSFLKDKDLRKKMSELGLPTYGARKMLEKRHQEWVTIWNANCDSAKPKRRSELLKDLEVWEQTVGSRAQSNSKAAVIGQQIKDKDFDGAAWAARHDDSFKDLIANARRTRMQAQQKAKEASESEPQPGPVKEEVKEAQPYQEAHSYREAHPHQEAHPQPSASNPAVVDLTHPLSTPANFPHPQLAYMQQPYMEQVDPRMSNAELGGYLNAIAYPNGAHFPENRLNSFDIPPRAPDWHSKYMGGPPS